MWNLNICQDAPNQGQDDLVFYCFFFLFKVNFIKISFKELVHKMTVVKLGLKIKKIMSINKDFYACSSHSCRMRFIYIRTAGQELNFARRTLFEGN